MDPKCAIFLGESGGSKKSQKYGTKAISQVGDLGGFLRVIVGLAIVVYLCTSGSVLWTFV